ncbi:MAG TPA: ATP synthase F1 subunit delta [Candidatus Latescibacteria bacterium]|nr:ATP synthase F1 subunit delta [Candidatus Latescibacterota bacterium]
MAIHSRVSIRYARALVLAAQEADNIASLRQETEGLTELMHRTPSLVKFLDDPSINKHDKSRILNAVFGDHLSPLMRRFVTMLVGGYRERLLPDILAAVLTLLDAREGRVHAEVASATPFADAQPERLRHALEGLTGKKVTMATREEPDLGAGFVVRVGDTVFDASLRAQLAQMRAQLLQSNLRPAVRTS